MYKLIGFYMKFKNGKLILLDFLFNGCKNIYWNNKIFWLVINIYMKVKEYCKKYIYI